MSNCLEVSRNLRLCAGAEEYEVRIASLSDEIRQKDEALNAAIGALEGIQILEHGGNSDTYQAAGMALQRLRAAVEPGAESVTLWTYCFWMELADCEKNGRETIVFADVEKRVIELSRTMTEFPIRADDRLNQEKP